ncbi:hypothetical protein [Thalassomonas sp. RHCl1]|uniref:hypothetical protein n=1 Tax=Thalassomonas sp. RHCl1 TaxID=2995320 RepID=UPI00248B1CA7|nr:hypothetical protein [Thalassomonas sp. RHCl1]
MKECREDQVVKACSEEDITFPGMDSCIGVVCILQDGDRWATHCVQDHGSSKAIETMQNGISTKKVVSVLVLGNIDFWGTELESQKELVTKYKISDANYMKMQQELEQRNLTHNLPAAKTYLSKLFGCDKTKVYFARCSGNVRQGGTEITSSRNDVVKIGW